MTVGATIRWVRVDVEGQTIDVASPSSFITAMESALGMPPPWRIRKSHHDMLCAMAIAFECGNSGDNPFRQMAQLVEDGSAIDVWPEY